MDSSVEAGQMLPEDLVRKWDWSKNWCCPKVKSNSIKNMETEAHFKGLDVNPFGFMSVVNIRFPVTVRWTAVNKYYIHPGKKWSKRHSLKVRFMEISLEPHFPVHGWGLFDYGYTFKGSEWWISKAWKSSYIHFLKKEMKLLGCFHGEWIEN